jgi:hypothetical protein
MQVTQFNHTTVRVISQRLEQVLKEEFGITVPVTGRFNTTQCNLKIQAKLENKAGESVDEVNFKRHAVRYGLKPTDWNRAFLFNGKRFVICGLVTRRPKFPIVATGSDGKRYKFPISTVVKGFV